MLAVKQKRNTDFESNNFYTKITTKISTAHSLDIYGTRTQQGGYYEDTCLCIDSSPNTFSSSNTYYLRVTIHNDDEQAQSTILSHNLNIFLALQNGDNFNDSTKPLQFLNALAYSVNLNTDYYLDIVFTPILDIYDNLVFKINRTNFDALRDDGGMRQINITEASLYSLNNLKDNSEVYWKKMGVQARPGTLIVVNKEPIRIGRSGIYELNNGTKITSFMLTPAGGTQDSFLVDYIYENGR